MALIMLLIRRRSERVKAGLARRRAEGKPVGRQVGAKDRTRPCPVWVLRPLRGRKPD